MTLPVQIPIVAYVGNGVTTLFTFPFTIFEAEDLVVELNAVVQSSGFAVSGVGADSGDVTFTAAPAAGVPVVLYRRTALARDIDYQDNGDLLAPTLNQDFDRLWGAQQELGQSLVQAVQIPFENAGQGTILPAAAARASKAMILDAAGNVVVSQQNWQEPQTLLDSAKAVAEILVGGVAPGSGTGMFLADGVGAVARAFQDKMRDGPDLRDYGVKIDANDHTADIQRALNEIASGGTLTGPAGIVNCGNIQLTGSNIRLDLRGTTFKFFGTAAANNRIGLQLLGTIDSLQIFGGRFICDGVLANSHVGIYSLSGLTASNIYIFRNYVENGVNGISCNANLSGSYSSAWIFQNIINGTVGTDSGQGYGIHFADGSGQRVDTMIFQNRIYNATRHSIYFARGVGGAVFENRIYGHRSTVADGSIRAAINLQRSNDADVFLNKIYEPNDGGILIGKTGANGLRNKMFSNTVVKSALSNAVPCLMVGSQDPTSIITDTGDSSFGLPEGSPGTTLVLNNHCEIDNNLCDMIRIYSGLVVKVRGNTGNQTNVAAASQAIFDYGRGGDAYNSEHEFEDNSFHLNAAAVIARLDAGLVGTTFHVRFRRNESGETVTPFAVGAAMDNPNIGIYDMAADGMSMVAGVYPQGRYVVKSSQAYDPVSVPGSTGGTLGTATINFSIPGIKKGDQVSVSFDQIGTAIELLTPYANSNNNVRLILLNLSASATDLPAGTLDIEVRRNTVDY